jgi:hypothetical protein
MTLQKTLTFKLLKSQPEPVEGGIFLSNGFDKLAYRQAGSP